MTTIKDAFRNTYHNCPDNVALRYKADGAWHEITYRDLLVRVRQVSELLSHQKLKRGDRVAIYLDNRREWPEIYLGITCLGLTAVPVDAKLRVQEVAHILRDSSSSVIFASARTYPVLCETEAHAAHLQTAFLIDGDQVLPVTDRRLTYLDYEESMMDIKGRAGGDDCAFNRHDPEAEDVASIIYTSGTTGRQKGAMLTHANFCSNVGAVLAFIDVRDDDNFLLVLPLHHAFAFTGNLLVPLFTGAAISFIENLRTVGENTREVSPTVLIGVPLLIEKMYARIMAGLKRKKIAYLMYRLGITAPVIKGIQRSLGGKLRLSVVGGAPCSVDVLKGFEALGIPILEGYGLTETAPVLTLNPKHAPRPGSVGKTLPGIEMRVTDPNEEGIGELIARGPNVMKGYFKNEQATREVIDDDEWFSTGDLGFIDDDGYITITGRKKSLIVNREGKNVYPEEVEACVLQSHAIMEALVLGYTEDNEVGERVGVIVVPDQEALDERARHKGPMSDADITAWLISEVKRTTRDIADYKRPRRILVRTEEFEKTSTGKAKRYLYAITPAAV